jgi:glycerol-3-phosphate dehydrogenase
MQSSVNQLAQKDCDLLIVGGGINGVGIARDAAGRGLSVILCEQHDLAQHTSSASTKLIHGGLRYLEYYEFKLVRKALQEREVLLRAAPHIMWPLRFVMPHDVGQRPAWMIRAGLFLYDHLAHRNFLPSSKGISLRKHLAGLPLKGIFHNGFEYSDGWVDDARLVVLNALDASERGANILTRTKCLNVLQEGTSWRVSLDSEQFGHIEVRARAVVNATGPWTEQFANASDATKITHGMRLVKGSHIIVPRLFEHPYAYIFQNPDKRIIFAIPYQDEFTLIGTTDLEYSGDPGKVQIDADEINYLCQMANRYFTKQISADDVVWSFSGVRPLLEDSSQDASAVTRDYRLELENNSAPFLNVWGGKITTYRKLSEEVLDILLPCLGSKAPIWTATAPLPGGDLQQANTLVASYDFASFSQHFCNRYPWLPVKLAQRYARCYGTRATRMLGTANKLSDMGEELAPGMYEIEARYLFEVEWARSAEDILWRRTKCGLHCNTEHFKRLQEWIKQMTL